MKRQTMNTRPFSLPIWAQALLAGAAFAAYASQAAYADSLEERLRTQLRSTTQQPRRCRPNRPRPPRRKPRWKASAMRRWPRSSN